jgi:hypothetical protein
MDTPFNAIETEKISREAENYTKIVNKCVKQLPANPILTELKKVF